MLILGAHVSISEGFAKAAEVTALEYQCNAMQIFTKSPRSRVVKPISEEQAKEFRANCEKFDIKFVVAHSSYLLNFGKPMSKAPWMKDDLVLDFERINTLGGYGVVVHVGKAMDIKPDEALNNVIENAKIILENTAKYKVKYLFENTAGQGSEVGTTFEELEYIKNGLKDYGDRVKFCLDTAHMWGAGYDLHQPEKVLSQIEKHIGINNIGCFHFNDSKKELGSRVDRHDNFTEEGKIGLDNLVTVANFAINNDIPLILETPEDSNYNHLTDINTLKAKLTK